jgi:hypothetical protein
VRFAQKLRHRWEAFAEGTGLRFLPPVGAALIVLAAGVLLPFVPRVDALPPQLAPSLAAARVTRFVRAHADLPEAGPSGAIFSTRPAFYWPAHPDAKSYSFRLERADGTQQAAADGITRTFHFVPPPGRLVPGEYRFSVHAVAKGERIPWQERQFTVRPAPEELEQLTRTLGMDLGGAESAYVLLGCYADLQSPHDVVSAFLQWKSARGEADSLGEGPPSAWLNAYVGR